MWFKKKSVLIAEGHYNTEKSADGVTDMRTTDKPYNNTHSSSSLPSAADANNYFYLPALGYYIFGRLNDIGNFGMFWSSSSPSGGNTDAYRFYFNNGNIYLDGGTRNIGCRVQAFE